MSLILTTIMDNSDTVILSGCWYTCCSAKAGEKWISLGRCLGQSFKYSYLDAAKALELVNYLYALQPTAYGPWWILLAHKYFEIFISSCTWGLLLVQLIKAAMKGSLRKGQDLFSFTSVQFFLHWSDAQEVTQNDSALSWALSFPSLILTYKDGKDGTSAGLEICFQSFVTWEQRNKLGWKDFYQHPRNAPAAL